jgi:hypothetical protein
VLIKSLFKLVKQTKAKYGICDKDVYNFNEAGFMIGKIITQLVDEHVKKGAKVIMLLAKLML